MGRANRCITLNRRKLHLQTENLGKNAFLSYGLAVINTAFPPTQDSIFSFDLFHLYFKLIFLYVHSREKRYLCKAIYLMSNMGIYVQL